MYIHSCLLAKPHPPSPHGMASMSFHFWFPRLCPLLYAKRTVFQCGPSLEHLPRIERTICRKSCTWMVNPWFALCFCLNNSIECIFSWVVLNIDIALRANALLVNSRKIEVAHIVFTVNSKVWPTEVSNFTKYQRIVLTCYSQTLTNHIPKWNGYDMTCEALILHLGTRRP